MSIRDYTTPKRSLDTLPVECQETILCFLPSLDALKDTILTHRSLYQVYIGHREFILRQVTLNHISPDLLPDAMLALSASCFDSEPWTAEKLASILDEHRARQIPSSFPWTVANVAKLYSFHRHVQIMSAHFIAAAALNQPAIIEKDMSKMEWVRIERSFYRFEIYRHLFKDRELLDRVPRPQFGHNERWDIYYKHFAAWELEQLACVSEHLFRTIARPFNAIAAHDVEWGYDGIAYPLTESWDYQFPSHVLHVLSQGIAFLRKVITASTYEDCRKLLNPVARYSNSFLPSEIPRLLNSKLDETLPLMQYTQAQIEPWVHSEAPELDSGPAEAWAHAHLKAPWPRFAADINTRDLRRWGYVMWDQSRLGKMGFFETPFVPPPPPDPVSERDRIEAVLESLIERRILYVNGARGWWAEGDESHLEWVKPWELSDDEENLDMLMEIVSL